MPTIIDQIWTVRNLDVIRHQILISDEILITGHSNPDGDSIGALLSLGLGLESIGKKVHMVCHDQIPKRYRHLPGISRIEKNSNHSIDLAIAVDCGSKEMIGQAYELFKKAKTILEIDHHRSRIPFGDISFVDPDASSAGELIYELLIDLDIPVTIDIAQNILTSILVETNSFRLPGIRPHTFELCADLLRTGVNFLKIAESVYWVTSKETAILSGICLARCKFAAEGQIAWSIINQKDFKKAGATEADADPITEEIRSIQGVKIAILIREKNRKLLRISFRSKEGIDVASIAEKFGGGGHNSAAGCIIPKNKNTLKELLNYAETALKTIPKITLLSKNFAQNNYDGIHSENENAIPGTIPAGLLFDEPTEPKINEHEWEENDNDIPCFSQQFEHKVAL